MIFFSTDHGRKICSCNTNYIQEGIRHPDRILDVYDFLYLKKGTWDIYEDDICYPLKENQLLILEPGRHHYSLEACSPNMRNLYLHCTHLPADRLHPAKPDCFRPQRAKMQSQSTENTSYAHSDQNMDTCCDRFFQVQKVTDCSGNRQIEHLMLQIIETYWSSCSHRALRLESLFFLLLAQLEHTGEAASCMDPLITDIIHQFYLCPDRFYSPQELADACHISVRSLSSRFKKSTGVSIHRYQMDLKLHFANEQIPLYPQRRLREIALDLGFYDEFQFSRLFKQKFGCSPSDRR